MKIGILFFVALLISPNLNAQSSTTKKCISIEGKNLGCVPSAFDTCHSGQPMNCKLGGVKSRCVYVKDLKVDYYYEFVDGGPKAYKCAEWDKPECNTGGDVQTCSNGKCIKYHDPICKKSCKLGYLDAQERDVPRFGCKRFCGEVCANEPQCETCDPTTNPNCNPPQVCPLTLDDDPSSPYILPRPQLFDRWKPNTSKSCTAQELIDLGPDPAGTVHPGWRYEGGDPACPNKDVQRETYRATESVCPWIKYPGKPDPKDPAKDGCNPDRYKPGTGNSFPADCSSNPSSPSYCGSYCSLPGVTCKP